MARRRPSRRATPPLVDGIQPTTTPLHAGQTHLTEQIELEGMARATLREAMGKRTVDDDPAAPHVYEMDTRLRAAALALPKKTELSGPDGDAIDVVLTWASGRPVRRLGSGAPP